ncbi:hypothetical protein Csa_004430 [Cucumis sativus]|uniref:Uncharacterized protein n=1 Tax=Cucumis sativus TaxID=3659 RepID=A0A0A0KM28_CUCSA|nr:hypothetical protein Csa_004430 [Cucumis sativus]
MNIDLLTLAMPCFAAKLKNDKGAAKHWLIFHIQSGSKERLLDEFGIHSFANFFTVAPALL